MGKKIRLFILLVLTFMVVLVSLPEQAFTASATLKQGTVINCKYSVNVRSGPGTSYSKIGHASRGAVYNVTGTTGSWYRIDFSGLTGYIYKRYLSISESVSVSTDTTQMGTVVNCKKWVNVRSGPSTRYKKIGIAKKGAEYVVTGKNGSYYSVIYNGRTGYIYKKYLSVYTVATEPEPEPEPSQDVIIEGYYGSWAAYDGYTPLSIPADKLDIVAYAFAKIEDGKVVMGDDEIDPANFEDLSELKSKYVNLKTLISIGGSSGAEKFSEAALTEQSRSAFADSAVAFMKKCGFDGIDIDWEYPVISSGNSKDKVNFTLLMSNLREKLDAKGNADGKRYLLTFAGASEKFYTDNIELEKLAAYVDYALVMTYDMHGPWSSYADLNSPLYTPSETSPQSRWSCDDAIKLWSDCGFPKSKMIMGVPFYGYIYSGVSSTNNGLYQKFSSGIAMTYDEIISSYLGKLKRFVHPQAQVPYLYGNSTFVSYDDAESIALKAALIKQYGLAGAGIWELSGSRDGTLLDAIYGILG